MASLIAVCIEKRKSMKRNSLLFLLLTLFTISTIEAAGGIQKKTIEYDDQGRTELMRLIQENKGDDISRLLNNLTKEQINAKDKAGNPALVYTLDLCTQRDHNFYEIGEKEFPFTCCTNNPGNIELAKKLLDRGADINAVNNQGQTILLLAIQAPTLFQIPKGVTRLYSATCPAISIGKIDFIKMLLTKKPNLYIKDKAGKSAVDYALNNNAVLGLLLPYFDINFLQSLLMRTLLETGKDDIIKKIIGLKKELLNMQDNSGATALMYAAKAGNGPLVKFLLLQDANFRLKDKQGRQAVDYARQADNKKVGEDIARALSEVEKISMLLGRFPFGARALQASIHEAVEKWQI